MSKIITLRKGLDINLQGKAQETLAEAPRSSEYAVSPLDFEGVTPKLLVKVGDKVKAGTPLFFNKYNERILFTSPVSGTVTAINRGEKRKVLNVTVAADAQPAYEEFARLEPAKASREEIVELLLKSGLWPMLVQRPYGIIADPNDVPKAVFISAFDSAPLAPDFEYVLKGREADFRTGLNALSRMAPVYLGVSARQQSAALLRAEGVTVTVFDGPHPAGNTGVQIHHVNPINKGEQVWTLGAEEVIFIGHLARTGRVDLTRTIALAGSEVLAPGYARLMVGAGLSTLLYKRVADGRPLRVIDGNVLTGRAVAEDDAFLGAHSTQVTVIPDGGDVDEFLGWIRPRLNDFSTSRSYFSWLFGHKREYTLDARVKGSERHMIMSGEYDRVLPMDILPEFLIKAILAGDIDRMEALGIYEVAPEDFALCEFVDSSKLELQRIVREGLDMLRRENEGD